MPAVLFVTHAEVAIDPAVPVPDWGLSPRGRARHEAFAVVAQAIPIAAIYCSMERKAVEAAEIMARATGVPAQTASGLHENDRSATGYLPPDEFEATADRFFARPEESIRGWERAVDAQSRIVRCVDAVLRAEQTPGDVVLVAHGGVGALLLCHLRDEPISRGADQPGRGGGNWFAFDRSTRRVLHGWRPIA